MIEYRNTLEEVNADNLKGFFVGWPNPPVEDKHYELLEKSAYIWIAIDSETGNVVGFINAVSDQVLSAYIPLLEVLPEYQRRGIGKQLVKNMIETLSDLYMVDLMCDENMMEFYDKFEMFRSQGMILRNYDMQNGR